MWADATWAAALPLKGALVALYVQEDDMVINKWLNETDY